LKLLFIDNYDSFTWNLVQILRQLGVSDLEVVKNDVIPSDYALSFDAILISPGPGIPSDSGITIEVIRKFYETKSILGICLGHQAIAEAFGGKLFRMDVVKHGRFADVCIEQPSILFDNVDGNIEAGLYHSWAVSDEGLPDCLQVTARSSDGVIMALQHRVFDVCSVQFHPESIMTPIGPRIIENWLQYTNNKLIN
jgi:anthranilate synthase component II